jgi:hypothetical protein
MKFAYWLVVAIALSGCGDGDGDDGPDSGPDAALSADAGPADSAVVEPDAQAELLSQTGLYTNIATKTIAPGMIEYAPTYALWSDGAAKRRWISLPPGTKIDTSDMDHWQFPIGTRFFKEFSTGASAGIFERLETREIEKIGDDQFRFMAYVWDANQADAVAVPNGASNVGSAMTHDVPSATDCRTCHRGEAGRILGFSAAQLWRPSVGNTEVTVDTLVAHNTLTVAPPATADYTIPGTATERAAIGFLHANCGHCHNPTTPIYNQTHMVLRYDLAARTVATTNVYLTAVGQDLESPQYLNTHPGEKRITPGMHATSAIWVRDSTRGNNDQMPPSPFTEITDPNGIAAITAWIDSLPP